MIKIISLKLDLLFRLKKKQCQNKENVIEKRMCIMKVIKSKLIFNRNIKYKENIIR